MRKLGHLLLALNLVLFVAGCGNDTGGGDNPIVDPPPKKPTEPVDEASLQLVLFAAPWCGPCKTELPAVQSLYNERIAPKKGIVSVTVFVTTGANQTQKPTQQIADDYGTFLKLNFAMKPDLGTSPKPFPSWANYRKYFKTGFTLPAAAVLNKDGEVLKTYISPDPQELIQFVESKL